MNESEKTSTAILLRNTMAFEHRHAAEFKQAILNAVAYAKTHAPRQCNDVSGGLNSSVISCAR